MDRPAGKMASKATSADGRARGRVVVYTPPNAEPIYAHEQETVIAVARGLAALKGFAFDRDLTGCGDDGSRLYYVPDDSLLPADAERLGIQSHGDLFGGVVPWRFGTTKAITHGLVDASADQPKAWPVDFASNVGDAVLPGYTAFSRDDALTATKRLLRSGTVRLKPPLSSRGRDQRTVRNPADLEGFLERYRPADLEECGLVLETELRDMATLSVGSTVVDETAIAYCGIQRTTKDNDGLPVYGGSDLVVVRGGWEALRELRLSRSATLAVEQAMAYDAAMNAYPQFYASRRNYDVGQGKDSSGDWRSGVLEASWRVGGSSTAELAAMEAMKRDRDIGVVHVSAIKEFGNVGDLPANADLHFHGEDPEEGPVTRYTFVAHTSRE